jgi:hypothetical protein
MYTTLAGFPFPYFQITEKAHGFSRGLSRLFGRAHTTRERRSVTRDLIDEKSRAMLCR